LDPWLDPAVKFGVLGPVEVRADGDEPRLGGPKPRALLAMLLLHANSVVARGTLIDGVWGERAPPSAGHTLDDYLSRLRKELGSDRITTRSPGYALRVEPGELDLAEFESLVERGRECSADGRPRDAADAFQAALALWRGPALADVLDAPFAHGEAVRLDEQRLAAREDLYEAALACGRSAEIVGELERLVAEEPLRERPLRLLMRSCWRASCSSSARMRSLGRASPLRCAALRLERPARRLEGRGSRATATSAAQACHQRSDLKAARISVEKSSGSSQVAKWPPLSTSWK
jgi:DNA-binding SARP family transcriptional activator